MRRRTATGLVVAAAVAVLVAAGVIWWVATRAPSAEEAATRYLDALAAGDAERAVAMRVDELGDDERARLVDAFAGASEYAADPRIESVDTAADRARVRATVSLAGERRTMSFGLTMGDGAWRLDDDHLTTLSVTTTLGDAVHVGDALLPAGEQVALLPAVYPVAAAPRAALDGETTAVVVGGAPVAAEIEASVSPEAVALAQPQLEAYEDACTRTAAQVPPDCGLRVPWAADLAVLDQLAWRIEQRPALTLAADGSGFAATGGAVVATATGTAVTGGPATFTYRADDWALRGSVIFSGDSMTLAVH